VKGLLAGALVVVAASCGGGTPDARYPERHAGCAVKTFPAAAEMPVDDLGPVAVDCDPGGRSCERKLLDAVCARGGDVAWGLGDNALTATHLTAHAGHSKRVAGAGRARGCAVQAFTEAPPMQTENVGEVTAICSADDSRETCLRELEDQTCLLGGDVVWQVQGPAPFGDKQRMRGQAAHSK
jgi:hypothetical protein